MLNIVTKSLQQIGGPQYHVTGAPCPQPQTLKSRAQTRNQRVHATEGGH